MVGPAILRLRGHYFAGCESGPGGGVAGNNQCLQTGLTGGGMGLNLPTAGNVNVDAQNASVLCEHAGFAALIAIGLATLIWRSRWGWAMRCVEQNERRGAGAGRQHACNQDFWRSRRPRLLQAWSARSMPPGSATSIPPMPLTTCSRSRPIVMGLQSAGVGTIVGPVGGARVGISRAGRNSSGANVLNFHAGILGHHHRGLVDLHAGAAFRGLGHRNRENFVCLAAPVGSAKLCRR